MIGYVARSAYVDGSWWPFDEYLLYAPSVGFRWLACSDGHWSYVQPVATGAVSVGLGAKYDGVAFRRFQTAELRVDSVLGEFYWRVQAGERVRSEDYIAPPAMLSLEATKDEQNWSLSSYLTTKDVDKAFGKSMGLASPVGVGPNQPYAAGIGKVTALVTVAFFAVGIGKCASAPASEKLRQHFAVPMNAGKPATAPTPDPSLWPAPSTDPTDPAAPPAPTPPAGSDAAPAEPAGDVKFSDKFQLDGGKNVVFDLSSDVNNNWVYATLDLVNDDTGSVVSIDKTIEYYSGFDSDGSWTEGSTTADEVIGAVEAGTYVLRVESQHGGLGSVDLEVAIHQGVFRWLWFWVFLGVLAVPFGFVGMNAYSFRKRQWENSNTVDLRGLGLGSSFDSGGDDDD